MMMMMIEDCRRTEGALWPAIRADRPVTRLLLRLVERQRGRQKDAVQIKSQQYAGRYLHECSLQIHGLYISPRLFFNNAQIPQR